MYPAYLAINNRSKLNPPNTVKTTSYNRNRTQYDMDIMTA